MSSNLINQLSGRIQLSLGEQDSLYYKKRVFAKTRKQVWDFQDFILNLEKTDRGLDLQLDGNGSIRICFIEISFPLKSGWTPLLNSGDWAPWCYLGNRKKQDYLLLTSEEAQSEIRIRFTRGRMVVRWDCRKMLLAGERFKPGKLTFHFGDPRLSQKNLLLPSSKRKAPLISARLFSPREGNPGPVIQVKEDLDRLKNLQIPLDLMILKGNHLPQPGEKPGSLLHKEMDHILAELKRRDIGPAVDYFPLRIPRQSQVCSQHPSWFLQDRRGKPITRKYKGQIFQVLDTSHKDVQRYLVKQLEMYRNWGFHHLMLSGLDDLLILGRRQNPSDALIEDISSFLSLIRQAAGEVDVLYGDRFFPTGDHSVFQYILPPAEKREGMQSLNPLLTLFPLVSDSTALSAGPLYLTRSSSSLPEKVRERMYHFQLLAGGLFILGGPTASLDEESAHKWNRLLSYHKGTNKSRIRMEPLGFQQGFLILRHNCGIAAVFNLTGRKRALRMTTEEGISEKKIHFDDHTKLNSPDLTISLPGHRSRALRF